MIHLDEKNLELYVLDAKEISGQRAAIEKHLKECPGCASLYEEIREYYSEVELLQQKQATVPALSFRDRLARTNRFQDRGSLRPVAYTLPARAARFVVHHPLVSSVSLLALFLAGFLFLYPKKTEKDLNPAYARAKNEFLIAYNRNGDELWRKHFGLGCDYEDYVTKLRSAIPLEQLLSVIDVDGDGRNQVVCINPWAESFSLRKTVYCYNADGSERWSYPIHRNISFGGRTYSDDYLVIRMMIGDFDRDGVPEVIASATHQPDFPCVLIKLDARNGKLLGEYWHPGYVYFLNHKDMDGDGVEELMFGGVNNAYGLGALVILDPRRFSGHGPGTRDYIPAGIADGFEKYYLLFPRNDLEKVALDKKNMVTEITPRVDGSLQVGAGESVGGSRWLGVSYYFDDKMRLVRLLAGDEFQAFHHHLEAEGKLTRKLDEQYYKELIDGVRYWDGEKFVHQPTMNKYYQESFPKP